jgi:hypothetical protein
MAISYVGVRQGTSLATAEPSGCAADDIILALFNSEDSGTLTPATGFTLVDGYTYGRIGMQTLVYWARRSSSAVATNWSGPGGISIISTIAYRGCKTSGSPIDIASKNNASTATMTWLGVTTTAANDWIVGFSGVWNWNTISTYSFTNERMDGGGSMPGHIFDSIKTTAGATGNYTATWPDNYDTVLVALLEDTGGGGGTGTSYIGTTALSAAYVGTTAVDKLYVGTTQVFP